MSDAEFWTRAFFSSKSWNADGNAFNESRALHAGEMADAALAEYRKRFGAVPAEKEATMPSARNTRVSLEMEREKLASLERTQGQDSPAIAESRAKIARLEQLVIADR